MVTLNLSLGKTFGRHDEFGVQTGETKYNGLQS